MGVFKRNVDVVVALVLVVAMAPLSGWNAPSRCCCCCLEDTSLYRKKKIVAKTEQKKEAVKKVNNRKTFRAGQRTWLRLRRRPSTRFRGLAALLLDIELIVLRGDDDDDSVLLVLRGDGNVPSLPSALPVCTSNKDGEILRGDALRVDTLRGDARDSAAVFLGDEGECDDAEDDKEEGDLRLGRIMLFCQCRIGSPEL